MENENEKREHSMLEVKPGVKSPITTNKKEPSILKG